MIFVLNLVTLSVTAAEKSSGDRPNMIVILVDDLGYGDLTGYGAKDLQSPQIDTLMNKGMKFENFYANCPVCSPTRAALLSGRYQDMVGVPGVIRTHPENNWGYLDPSAILLPRLLQEAGYQTAIVGKWHLGLDSPNIPNDRGFHHFKGYLGDMMDDYYTHRRHGINYMRENRKEIDPEGHATDLFTQWACDYIEEHKNVSSPFFLYLAYNAPHTPIQPPEEWTKKVMAREKGISKERAKLVALIEHMDDGIGKVMKCLEETGQSENTIVVFSSDNGGYLNAKANNGPWRDGKQTVYEGGIRVPTIVSWPGVVKEGSNTEIKAMSMDILPTLFEATGIDLPEGIEGRSFLPSLKGEEQEELREYYFFRRREGGIPYGGKTIEAVIHNNWKLLQNSPFEPMELYDLKNDPYETKNLINLRKDIYRSLAAELRKEIQRYGTVPWQKPID